MSEIQEQIQRHIDTLVGTGAETGVQVAVYQDGALIVDAVAATLAHLLVARGFVEYDSLVTDLWPEFGVRGKATATILAGCLAGTR
jgi:hypothetical protein